jgi:hypothetical protein
VRSFDHATFGDAFARPGLDTRQWLSYGLVQSDTDNQHSIHFDDEEGSPIPEGPIVVATLQPSNITVPCRVAGSCAGNGEGEWFPFQQGDEVLVAIPEGDERAGCVIIARLNNELDAWPRVVAGQDSTGNNFGFRRLRTPYILETAASYLVRSAVTGAQFGIDQQGQFILNDGDGSRLFMGADAVGFSSGDGSTSLQILVGDKQLAMTAGSTASFLLDAKASQFTSKGTLSVGTTGLLSLGHAVTMEEVLMLLVNYTIFLNNSGVTFAPPLFVGSPEPFQGLFVSMVAAQAAGVPFTGSAAFGGNGAFYPLIFGPAGVGTTLLGTQLANFDVTGFVPGIGRSGFLY